MTGNDQRRPRRTRWLKVAAAVYGVLLLASTLARIAAEEKPLPQGRETTWIHAPASGDRPVRLAWREWGGPAAMDPRGGEALEQRPGDRESLTGPATKDARGGEALPLVLLHGSPGSADDFRRLAPRLAQGRRVIAPDLPGFGASERRVDDYSIRAHAEAALALLDELGIQRFHALGFSMGGGPALHLAEDFPDRVASIVLVASIGVQELELLGNYTANHAVHGLQLGLFRGLRNLVPHFGAFDQPIARSYARNFHDTDQRPLRGILESLEMPVFIIHGEQDPLVPAAAALEHHRIVPHSALWMRPDSHFFLFRGGGDLASRIDEFLGRVEAGEAPTRADAEPERLRRAAPPFAELDPPPFTGPALLIVFLLLVVAAYVSEDLTCITAGLLVAQGRLDFSVAVAACYVGNLSSDICIAWLARILGRPALRLPPFRWWVSGASIEEASAWLRRRGLTVVLASRFLPGTRLPTCLAVGILRTRLLRFCCYFAVAAAIWTPAFVGVNALLGGEAVARFGGRLPGGFPGAVLALALVIFTVRSVVVPLLTWRGRRRWRGRLLRIRHWEFWPMWAFYPPLFLFIAWHGLRRRRPAFFTAINPAMPLGGLLGESKSDILDGLAGIGDALPAWRRLPPGKRGQQQTQDQDRPAEDAALETSSVRARRSWRTSSEDGPAEDAALATSCRTRTVPPARHASSSRSPATTAAVDPEERIAALRRFLRDQRLDYPVVLKPDSGERGRGVAIARSEADAQAFFEKTPGPALVQEYVAGEEYGVFWARRPGRSDGHVFSITHKLRPSVVGDGESTLERLILLDRRAVAIARIYAREHPGAAKRIPAAGEVVALTEVGAHSRGTIFLDANDLHTPELESAINAISTAWDGFDFGRFDVRVPCAQALRRGENIRVLEVNGVTSEATHMYDRRYGFFAAHAILRRQWALAFDLADERIRAGAEPATAAQVIRAVRTERRTRNKEQGWRG